MFNMVTVSIILLNYNWKNFNKNCIDSILIQDYQDFEIIFVDQCSTDWSLEEVEILYKKEIKNWKIKIIKNNENNWFAGWNNLWFFNASKSSEYIRLLNNDTIIERDSLSELIIWIKNKNIWAVWSLVLDKWYENIIINDIYNNKKKPKLSFLWENTMWLISNNELNKWILDASLSWCSLLLKKNTFKFLFEDYYFAYAEDVYLNWRIINHWLNTWLCLSSIIHHYGSWSFGKKPTPIKLFHGNKNQIINYLIFYPFLYRLLLFPLFILKEFCHIFYNHPLMRIKYKFLSRCRIIKHYSLIVKSRKVINKERKISTKYFFNKNTRKISDIFYQTHDKKIICFFINILNKISYSYCYILNKFL